jgi:hypothetical protein
MKINIIHPMKMFLLRQHRGVLTNIITGLVGLVLILLGILFYVWEPFGTLFLSVGASILATSIVTYISSQYLVRRSIVSEMCDKWGLQKIYETRSETNVVTTGLIEKSDYLDIIAFGLKSFRDAKSDLLEQRIKSGMRLRILVPNPDSSFLSYIDDREGVTRGSTANDIKQLKKWIEKLTTLQKETGCVALRFYTGNIPLDFYFAVKGALFVGPYKDKDSQQTLTYEYTDKGLGYIVYARYFEKRWNEIA